MISEYDSSASFTDSSLAPWRCLDPVLFKVPIEPVQRRVKKRRNLPVGILGRPSAEKIERAFVVRGTLPS